MNLRLGQDLDDTSGLFQRDSVVTIDHMSLSGVGGNDDKRDLQVCGLLLRRLVVMFENVVNRRRFTKQIEIRIWSA